jgi:hypothetical protein
METAKYQSGFGESCVKNAFWALPYIRQVRYAAHIRESGQREKRPVYYWYACFKKIWA